MATENRSVEASVSNGRADQVRWIQRIGVILMALASIVLFLGIMYIYWIAWWQLSALIISLLFIGLRLTTGRWQAWKWILGICSIALYIYYPSPVVRVAPLLTLVFIGVLNFLDQDI